MGMTDSVKIPVPGLGQLQKCGWVKPGTQPMFSIGKTGPNV